MSDRKMIEVDKLELRKLLERMSQGFRCSRCPYRKLYCKGKPMSCVDVLLAGLSAASGEGEK